MDLYLIYTESDIQNYQNSFGTDKPCVYTGPVVSLYFLVRYSNPFGST